MLVAKNGSHSLGTGSSLQRHGMRGKSMYTNVLNGERNTVAFVVVLLLTTLIPTLLPNATATSMLIDSVTPGSGNVGDLVRIVGQIETANGSYAIFFDEVRVRNGTAMEMTVNDTFNVPSYPEGGHSITLHDTATANNATDGFTINTSYFIKAIVPTPPEQLQEGAIIEIQVQVTGGMRNTRYTASIAVTNPLGETHYSDLLQLANTTDTGHGEGSIVYPTAFGSNTHTNYTGIYHMALNGTLATGNFTMGLTDKTEYRRSFEDDLRYVHIQGSGYGIDETVTIDIMTSEVSVAGYPKEINATDGMAVDSWRIPEEAIGIYTVTLRNTTSLGTNKPVPDAQNFTIVDIIISCQARNRYDKKSLVNISVEAYVYLTHITSGEVNNTGWIDFRLDRGNYTFKAFWNEELVGSLEGSVMGETVNYVLHRTFYIECELAQITVSVKDEGGNPLPFVNVNLTSNRPETAVFETNLTGTITTNAFTNASYTIESRRYGHLFDTTHIENLTYTREGRDGINITCPTYDLFVYVLDSKGHALKNVRVSILEWTSERIVGSGITDSEFGNITFILTFGKYRIEVYEDTELGHIIAFNKTVVDLVENRFFFALHCRICGLDSSVKITDYFGQPIPNADVRLEQKFEQEYVDVANLTTNSNGIAPLPETGGDYRISVSVMGEECETMLLYLTESKTIEVKIDKYVSIGAYPLQVIQLITYISLALLITVFVLVMMHGRLSKAIGKVKTSGKD